MNNKLNAKIKTRCNKIDFLGHKIYYEVRGESKKTIVFIHGWTSSIESWKYQLNSFRDYKVIAIDLPGNGKSSKNKKAEYTIELFADSINKIMETEGIRKAVFFGHSMGFSVAEVLTQKYPELCVGVGSIDGTHFEIPEDEIAKKEWLEYNRSFAESLNTEKGRDEFINALFLPDTPEILRKEIFEMSRKTPLEIAKAMTIGVEKDAKFWEKRIMNVPCLAIHSPVFQLTLEYKKDFEKMYPKLEYYEIANVSHFLMLEMPYKINQIIYDYLIKIY